MKPSKRLEMFAQNLKQEFPEKTLAETAKIVAAPFRKIGYMLGADTSAERTELSTPQNGKWIADDVREAIKNTKKAIPDITIEQLANLAMVSKGKCGLILGE